MLQDLEPKANRRVQSGAACSVALRSRRSTHARQASRLTFNHNVCSAHDNEPACATVHTGLLSTSSLLLLELAATTRGTETPSPGDSAAASSPAYMPPSALSELGPSVAWAVVSVASKGEAIGPAEEVMLEYMDMMFWRDSVNCDG